MAQYVYKCETCGERLEIEAMPSTVKAEYRRKCEKCGATRKFTRDWTAGIAAFHSHYSPMHPRANRGKGR